jgi:hypothetical protein
MKSKHVNKLKSAFARELGDSLLEHIKDGVQSAFSSQWSDVVEEVCKGTSIQLYGYEDARIEVLADWVHNPVAMIRLHDLVTERIDNLDGTTAGKEEAEWLDAISADLEKQAARCRKQAEKIRSSKY